MSAVPIEPRPLSLTKSIISRTFVAVDRHLRERGDLLEVVEPVRDAELDVLVRLLLGLGDVHHPDEAPWSRSATVPNLAARSSITSQCRPSRSKPSDWVAPIDSRPMP